MQIIIIIIIIIIITILLVVLPPGGSLPTNALTLYITKNQANFKLKIKNEMYNKLRISTKDLIKNMYN